MVGMAVGDDGPRDRPRRVDVKAARRAVQPRGIGRKPSYGRAMGAHASGPMVAIVPDMGTEVTIVSSRPLAPLQPVAFASPPSLEILAIFQRLRQLAAFRRDPPGPLSAMFRARSGG